MSRLENWKFTKGDADTRWSSSKKGVWVAREFEDPVEARSIAIQWYKGEKRSYSFRVETSTDGNTWRPAYSGKSQGRGGFEVYSFAAVYELSHLRIICAGPAEGSWSSIVAIQLD